MIELVNAGPGVVGFAQRHRGDVDLLIGSHIGQVQRAADDSQGWSQLRGHRGWQLLAAGPGLAAVAAGAPPQRVAAVQAGRVDHTILGVPGKRGGGHRLVGAEVLPGGHGGAQVDRRADLLADGPIAAKGAGELHRAVQPGEAVGVGAIGYRIDPDLVGLTVVIAHIDQHQGAIHVQRNAAYRGADLTEGGDIPDQIPLDGVDAADAPCRHARDRAAIDADQIGAIEGDAAAGVVVTEGQTCIRAGEHRFGTGGDTIAGREAGNLIQGVVGTVAGVHNDGAVVVHRQHRYSPQPGDTGGGRGADRRGGAAALLQLVGSGPAGYGAEIDEAGLDRVAVGGVVDPRQDQPATAANGVDRCHIVAQAYRQIEAGGRLYRHRATGVRREQAHLQLTALAGVSVGEPQAIQVAAEPQASAGVWIQQRLSRPARTNVEIAAAAGGEIDFIAGAAGDAALVGQIGLAAVLTYGDRTRGGLHTAAGVTGVVVGVDLLIARPVAAR